MELIKEANVADVSGKSEQDLHPGCVKRVLSYMDRLLILVGVATAMQGKGDAKSLAKLNKLNVLLDEDGVNDYFEAIEQDQARRMQDWGVAFKIHVLDRTKADPGPKPKLTEADQTGASATYWIPSKLDAHVIECLKTAQFEPRHSKYAVELFNKFGVAIDD